jgi:glycogen debranching enzyme
MSEPVNLSQLEQIPAPLEPRLAYREPQLSNQQLLALVRGKTFVSADRSGNIMPPGAPHVGFFRDDTRFLSRLELLINQQDPTILSSNTVEGAFVSRVELTVRGSEGEGLDFPVNAVYVHRLQLLTSNGFRDVLQIENYHPGEVSLAIELRFDADFMDIFQVRGIVRHRSGRYFKPVIDRERVTFLYEGLDDRLRSTTLSFSPKPDRLEGNVAQWNLRLASHGSAELVTVVSTDLRAESSQNRTFREETSGNLGSPHAATEWVHTDLESIRQRYDSWRAQCTSITSDNDIFNSLMRTVVSDFFSLQIPYSPLTAIAAGVPWFAALFGRDSLIASMQTLMLNPQLARGTLRVLADHQGTAQRDDNDEDPGKILHEYRSGEMTATGEIAFGRNYGSVDATPLFLILAERYHCWAGDDFLRGLKPNIVAAVCWLLDYADLDGDALIEYCRRSSKGLFNQGWKDSGDANLHADGAVAQPPVALVEVQGYAIRALRGICPFLDEHDEQELSRRASERASEIEKKLEDQFWQRDGEYYAMALDRLKQPLRVLSSNPGHLLFASVVSPGRAAQIVKTMLSEQLFSGWGIRTLGSDQYVYNPMSYHRGSVWPHDNSLVAYGMSQYGHQAQAAEVLTALYDTALHFQNYRLPELYCGIQRRQRDEPVHYPVSCSPQAWASGSLLMILTGLLGLRPDAGRKRLKVVDPYLPPFLHQLTLSNLRIGDSLVSLVFERRGDRTFCNLLNCGGAPISVSVEFQ